MNTKQTGLKAIACELGLSINTVSRALRDCYDISESTKEKVRNKAYELGYVPNNVAQFIKGNNNKLIALVADTLKNLYFYVVHAKIAEYFVKNNIDFTIIYSNGAKMTLDVFKQCVSQRVDGIITLIEPEEDVVTNAKLNLMPMVLIGRHINNSYVDEVYTNDSFGGGIVANYLMNFHRLDKFIYIKMPGTECSKRRQESFVNAVTKNLPSAEVIILDYRHIKNKLLKLIKDEYLGIFCFNDEVAYKALEILNNTIPNIRRVYPRLHIIGYDGLANQITGLVDLTSVEFDYDAIIGKAIELLLDKFKHPKREAESHVFDVSLHTRKII